MTRRVWPVLVAAALGCIGLVALGAWQIQRLHWKEALIAERDARLMAPAVTLGAAIGDAGAGLSVEYLKIAATGRFRHDRELFYLSTHGGSPGFEVVTPLVTPDGITVLVDRGFVPETLREPARRPESQPGGEVSIEGYASRHQGGRGFFTPDNDAGRNFWYWWDIPAMLSMADVPADHRVAPFILHALPGGGRELPEPVPPGQTLSNNHLQYALTWFALALILALMAGLFIRQQLAGPGRES